MALKLEPGQVFHVVNEALNGYHVYLVLRRLEEDEDWSDGWGSKGGKSPHGWYWRFLDLASGSTLTMIDNSIELGDGRWEML
jgi:hypothetical protein